MLIPAIGLWAVFLMVIRREGVEEREREGEGVWGSRKERGRLEGLDLEPGGGCMIMCLYMHVLLLVHRQSVLHHGE